MRNESWSLSWFIIAQWCDSLVTTTSCWWVWPLWRPAGGSDLIGSNFDKNWPTGWVCIGFSFSTPWFPPQGLSDRWSLMHSFCCWERNILPLVLQGPSDSHCGGLKSGRLADLPLRPRNRWEKGWLLSGEGISCLTAPATTPLGWLAAGFPQGPCQGSYHPVEWCWPKEGMPARATVRDFVIFYFLNL